MNKLSILLIIVVFATFLKDCLGNEVCSSSYLLYKYCDDGYYCCDGECCSNSLAVGPIIGIVVASLTVLGSCISIICCLINKKNRPGQVVQPQPGGQQPPQYPPQYGQQIHRQALFAQPTYGQQLHGQPHPFGSPANVTEQTTVGSNQPMTVQANPPPPPAAY